MTTYFNQNVAKAPLVLLCSALLVSACSNNNAPSEASAKKPSSEAASSSGCLMDYQDKLDKLLTMADVAAATGLDAAAGKYEYNKLMSDPTMQMLQFEWEGDKDVGFGAMDEATLFSFKHANYPKTDAELNKIEKEVTQALDKGASGGSTGSNDADNGVSALKDLGYSAQDIKETGKDFAQLATKLSKGIQVVDGVGEAAVWHAKHRTLTVYDSGAQYRINMMTSNDANVDLQRAKAVAAKVRCP